MQIALRGIHKQFPRQNGGSLAVLRDVSLTLEAGEFCCVVGSSGCGKSTILNIVAGLTLPDAGQVLVDDARLDASRIRIGYVFQTPRLLNWKTVRENVAFALRASGTAAAEARARASHYLELVGLAQFEREFPLALSGGMQHSPNSSANFLSRSRAGCSSGWRSPGRSRSSQIFSSWMSPSVIWTS
jgi:ABC-type nitrate/sulfonate/bicarbonate transport system ATPase subunit